MLAPPRARAQVALPSARTPALHSEPRPPEQAAGIPPRLRRRGHLGRHDGRIEVGLQGVGDDLPLLLPLLLGLLLRLLLDELVVLLIVREYELLGLV